MSGNSANCCLFCKKESTESHYYNSESEVFADKAILSCTSCGFSWAQGISQDALNQYYINEYEGVFSTSSVRHQKGQSEKSYFDQQEIQYKPHRSQLHIKLAGLFASYNKRAAILDCGAGLGTTLFYAKEMFGEETELTAYENSKHSRAYLEFLGATVLKGDPLAALAEVEGKFDVIIASHFLEHLAPAILLKYVECLKNLLEPSGILVAEVPNDDFVRFPHRRIHGNAPHTCFFSPRAFRFLFKNFDIKMFGTVGSPIRARSNPLITMLDRTYNAINHRVLSRPFTLSGDRILVCAGR